MKKINMYSNIEMYVKINCKIIAFIIKALFVNAKI